jgi:Fuc2NAc and GlcNAc transferase
MRELSVEVAVFIIAFSCFLSWFVTKWVIQHSARLGLVQAPNHRSSHFVPTPQGGGLGIIVATLLILSPLGFLDNFHFVCLLGGAVFLAGVGWMDDTRGLSIVFRLLAQFLVCSLFLLFAYYQFTWSPLALFLIFIAVGWINFFNFMDGLDGLAGIEALFLFLSGLSLIYFSGQIDRAEGLGFATLVIASALLGFLILNWPPAKIFMGSVGSFTLAFILFGLALLAHQRALLSFPVLVILPAVFVTDSTVTLLVRFFRRERWYEAHRTHAYQHLSLRWNNDRKRGHLSVTLLVGSINLFFLYPLAWACIHWPDKAMIWVFIAYAPLTLGALSLGAGKPRNA